MMPNEVQFTPHLVSFYPEIKYLKQDEKQKWYVEQVKVKQSEWYDKIKVNRGMKTSQTSASLVFYDEKQNNLFSKLPSDNDYPYGFIWNIDNNTNDECIFCKTDGHIVDYDFIDKKDFEYFNVNGINNLSKKPKKDMLITIYRGDTKNIMTFARKQTIDLAKKVYDTLHQELDLNKKITKQMLDDAINKIGPQQYTWKKHGYLMVDGTFYPTYMLYTGQGNTFANIVFNTATKQVSLLDNYNEIAIRSNNSRMYFNNLCVNIENMNESLKENHKNIKNNIENFKSFIDACLKIGSQDIVIFRNKKEEELANNANGKFWLKSSPLIKEKITFLEFIDKYCENFQQHFTEEQRQKIEQLRKKNAEEDKLKFTEKIKTYNQSNNIPETASNAGDKNNNVSLFGLGCYQTTNEEKNNSSCGCLFW